MGNNRSSVSHTIRIPGYKYDVLKGELRKRSIISKQVHPVSEVEEFKQRLLKRKLLKDTGTHWVLNKNVRTGHLMALNLHEGKLIKESPYKQDIIVSQTEAEELKDKLPEKNICVTDSEIVMKSIRDTLRFSSVSIMEVNADIFTHHEADTFGKEEAFVLKILQERGIVSPTARHGSAGKKEADIVDEDRGTQYEITYEFKTELPKKLMKPDVVYSPEVLTLQLVDSPFIHTSRALAKKLRKEYTNQHRSNLVILTLGTKQSIIAMLESLSEKLKKEQIEKLNYSNVYIISLDFLNEQALLARISSTEPFESESFPCKNDELGFIKLTAIEFSTIEDDRKYLMVCDGIFDDTHRCRYDEGRALKSWVKEIRPCSGFRVKSRPGFFTNIQDTSQSCVIASANLCFLELMIVGCIWSVCISNLVFVFIFLVAKLTKLNIKSTDREGATLSQRYPFFVWSNFLLILILAICCWLYFIDYADAGSWLLLLTKDNSMLSIIVGISGIGISFGILAAFLVRNSRKKKDSIEEGKVEAKQ